MPPSLEIHVLRQVRMSLEPGFDEEFKEIPAMDLHLSIRYLASWMNDNNNNAETSKGCNS